MKKKIENTPKLPKEFKIKWLKALRSGKYKQGKSRLYDKEEDTYCCLGVACDVVYKKPKWLSNAAYIGVDMDANEFTVKKIPSMLVGGTANTIVSKLSKMNDGSHAPQKSFNKIADWIEKHL